MSAEPPGGALRQSSFGLLTDYFHWTEGGVLSRGAVSLRDFEWTRRYPWIGDFEYEALLQTKENLRVEKGTRERYRIEYVPRYTLEMKAAHVARLRELPWVMPTPSADENLVLGQSHGWPEGEEIPGWPYDDYGDPAVPPQDIFGYMITDPEVDGPKVKVVLVDGNHASEMHGSWGLHAMVDFLASEDPRAATLRRKAVFFVYPMVDPDGRYHQSRIRTMPAQSRYPIRGNPQMYAAWAAEPDRWRPVAGRPDHNRIWNTRGAFATIDVHADFQLRGEGQRIQGVDDPYLRYVVGSFNIGNNIATLKGDRMEGADRQQQLEAMLRLNGRARWPYPGGGTGQDGRDALFIDWYFPTLDEMEAQWRAARGNHGNLEGRASERR